MELLLASVYIPGLSEVSNLAVESTCHLLLKISGSTLRCFYDSHELLDLVLQEVLETSLGSLAPRLLGLNVLRRSWEWWSTSILNIGTIRRKEGQECLEHWKFCSP